jgi:hypothetical protein
MLPFAHASCISDAIFALLQADALQTVAGSR